MTLKVGEVIAVHGIKVILKIFDESSKDMIFYNGDKFKGISIREHIIIQRGFKNIGRRTIAILNVDCVQSC